MPAIDDSQIFRSLGEQLQAVAKAEINQRVDQRLYEVHKRSTVAAAGGSEMVPSDGGFLVAPEFSREIMKRLYMTGDIFKRCMQIPFGPGNSFKFPQFSETSRVTGNRLGGIEAYWDNESQALKPAALVGTDLTQKPTFTLSELTAKKLTGYLYCSDELAIDSQAFETWASYAFGQEILYKLEDAIINGTGPGSVRGIMQSPALITVAAQPGQLAQSIVSQNVAQMIQSFWAKSYVSPSACWLYNQNALPQLAALATIVGTAGSQSSIWHWKEDGDDYDRLAGIYAIPSEYCQTPGTPGDLILCDLSRYLLAIREQRSEVSIHVKFIYDTSVFRWVIRLDGMTIDQAPVVPQHSVGSPPVATSPFVALAAR